MKNKYIFGQNLRYSEYSSTDGGDTVYAVYGEDPNCDMGGHHHNPFLGNYEGTFVEVLEHVANNVSGFYQWGGGGHIKPVSLLQEYSNTIVIDEKKKLKVERKKKLKSLMKITIDTLIEDVDTMSKDEIKSALLELKKNLK